MRKLSPPPTGIPASGKLSLGLLLALTLAACAGTVGQDSAPGTDSASLAVTPEPASVESMRDHALRDLTRRLNILSADIEVVSAKAVTWADGAMGCPLPGFSYTQALVPGFHVVLAVGEEKYHYHGGSVGRPLLCPQDRRQPPLERTTGSATE